MSPHFISAKSIKEAKYKAIKLTKEKGKFRRDQRGERTQYLRNLILDIPCENCELSDDPITSRLQIDFGLGLTDEDIAKERGENFIYGYGWEMREENALQKTVELLREDPNTRRATIPLFKPRHVGQEDVPCFCTLDFDIEDEEELNLIAFARSNDIVIAMQSDIYGFTRLQMWVAEQLGIETGEYCQHVVNAHIRLDSDGDIVKKVLMEGY